MKNKIYFVFNYLVSICLILWLAKKFDFHSAVVKFASADISFIIAAIMVSIFMRLIFSPFIWQEVLKNSGMNIRYLDLFSVNAISLPLKFFIPFKLSELVRAAGLKVFGQMNFSVALSSTIFLRMSVVIATFVIFSIGMTLNPLSLPIPEELVCGGLFILMIIFFNIGRLPKNFLWLGEVVDNLLYCFRKVVNLQKVKLLIYCILLQLGEIISSFLIFRSLGIEISFLKIICYVSLVMLVSMLPISIQGIGIRETMMIFSLSEAVSSTLILSAGLLLSLIHHIIPAFVGILLWIFSSRERIFASTVSKVYTG
jgi:uncharacterized membrane protein YbhN (UPF0104 family)